MRVGIHTEDAPFLTGKSCVLNNTTLSSGMKTFFKHNIYPITVLRPAYMKEKDTIISRTQGTALTKIQAQTYIHATYIHKTYIKHV